MEYKNAKAQIISNAVCGILMLISIIVYVVLGLLYDLWHPYWIIIVLAGMLCGIIGIIFNTRAELEELKANSKNFLEPSTTNNEENDNDNIK